jgi:hypothetical protein
VREAADRQEEIGNRLRLTHFADRIVEPERIASCIERLDIGMKVISVVMFVCSVAAALICVTVKSYDSAKYPAMKGKQTNFPSIWI